MTNISAFLHKRRVGKGSTISHTSFSKTLKGSFYLSVDEIEEFFGLYTKAIENGEELSITEAHQRISPILIDLDFKQTTKDRLYTDDMVVDFIKALKQQITLYLEVEDQFVQFFVLEKLEPRPDKNGGFKDGVHIVCPYICTEPIVQHKMRQDILSEHMKDIFGNVFTNTYEDIYDEAVIERNNWFMYGSKKPDEEYGWTLTKIYNIHLEEIDNEFEVGQLIRLLSIRNKDKATPIKADKLEVFTVKPREETQETRTHFKPTASEHEVIHQLVMMLNPSRANNYKQWIECGMCLKSIDERLLESWLEFSQQSPKYNFDECSKLWKSFTPKGLLTEGTLRWWAKQDNPHQYKEQLKVSSQSLMSVSMSRSHVDIAKVVHHFYKDQFRCCFLSEKPKWFEFKNHRWTECPDAITLKQLLGNDMSRIYKEEALRYSNLSSLLDTPQQLRELYESYATTLNKIAFELKMMTFQKHIITACSQLFYVSSKDFMDKLDENKYLLGFSNGVYDLEKGEFREGQPNDHITYSVGYDYTNEMDIEVCTELRKVLLDIFPQDVCQYMLNTSSYALSGNKYMEFLQFWIGTGANGKGVYSKLLTKALGDYCYCPDVSVFTTKKTSSSSANPELAKMKGKRLAIATEPNEEDKFQVGQLKAWTGGDRIQARQLYKDNIEFDPQFLIIVQMNHRPALSDFDMGIARRLKNVEFPYKFVENPQSPHERQGDAGLKRRIDNDIRYAQQFMLLLLENYRNNIEGDKKFDTPTRVEAFTKEYLDANNAIGKFLKEHCVVTNSENDMVLTKMLFEEFRASDHYTQKDIKHFVEHMGQCGFKSVRCTKRSCSFHTKQVFYGITIKTPDIMIEADYL